jgi:hypothetical protein
LKNPVPLTSRKGNTSKGGYSSNPIILYERLFISEIFIIGDKFAYAGFLVGP